MFCSEIFFIIFSFKIDGVTQDPHPDLDQDPDPNWVQIVDPEPDSDPNSIYLEPQHCLEGGDWESVAVASAVFFMSLQLSYIECRTNPLNLGTMNTTTYVQSLPYIFIIKTTEHIYS